MTNPNIKPVAQIHKGHPCWWIYKDGTITPSRLLSGTHPLYDEAALQAAVEAERERCAKICERRAERLLETGAMAARVCAAAIRGLK